MLTTAAAFSGMTLTKSLPVSARDGFVSINGGPKIANPPYLHAFPPVIAHHTGIVRRAGKHHSERPYHVGPVVSGRYRRKFLFTIQCSTLQREENPEISGDQSTASPDCNTNITFFSFQRASNHSVGVITHPNGTSVNVKIANSGRYSLKILNTKGRIAFEKTGIAPK